MPTEESFVVSLSDHERTFHTKGFNRYRPPFDRLRANG
jgi:hypothetical protein